MNETLYHDSDDYFRSMLADIGRARRAIEFETYIYERGILGDRLARELAAAASRGVTVRVLVDAMGSPKWRREYLQFLTASGIDARIFQPPPWSLFSYPYDWQKLPRVLLLLFQRANKRNHRKICVIDSDVAWVGSANVSDVHLREIHGEKAWRDTGLRLEGSEAGILKRAFEVAWHATPSVTRFRMRPAMRKEDRKAFENASYVRVNNHIALRRRKASEFLRQVRGARRRVFLATPYFVPTGSLLRALRLAARSGADVRLLVPRQSDVFFMPLANFTFYYGLLRSGVRIFEYTPRFFHAKLVLADEWATIGTSNLNHRSLLHDLEIEVVLASPRAAGELEEQFEKDFGESEEITMEKWKARPRSEKFLGRLTLLFYYWI